MTYDSHISTCRQGQEYSDADNWVSIALYKDFAHIGQVHICNIIPESYNCIFKNIFNKSKN